MKLENKIYRIEDTIFENDPLVGEKDIKKYFNYVRDQEKIPIKMYFCGPKIECSFAFYGEIYILEEHFKRHIVLRQLP